MRLGTFFLLACLLVGCGDDAPSAPDGATMHVMVRRSSARSIGLLLVHGFAANGRLWDGVADALATDGHASAVPDLRGHGRSSRVEAGFDIEHEWQPKRNAAVFIVARKAG